MIPPSPLARPGQRIALVALGWLLSSCGPSDLPRAAPARPEPPPAAAPTITAGNEYDGVVLGPAGAALTGTLDWDLRIAEGTPLRRLNPLLFGFNHAWSPNEELLGGAQPDPAVLAVTRGLPLPLNRLGGTDSQDIHWQEMIGPPGQRLPQRRFHKPPQGAPFTVGLLEWVRFCEAADPQARFSWTFNLWLEEPEDHADLVEFLTGTPGENRNGGPDWAERRAAYGHPRPVPVAVWELGNEIDWDSEYAERFPEVGSYIAYCQRTIAAVRAVQPTARFAAGAACSPWSQKSRAMQTGDWSRWHQAILAALGADLDWITFHPYYFGMSPAALAPYFDTLRDDAHRLSGGRVQVYLSEHAVWPERPTVGTWNDNWHATHDLSGVLGTAQFFCFMLRRPEIAAATYHSFNGGPWGVIRNRDATNHQRTAPYATGIATLHRLLAPFQAGTVVQTTARGARADPAKTDATADALAVLGPDGHLRLLLVNREAQAPRRLHLAFARSWQPLAGLLLTAPAWDSVNTADSQPIDLRALDISAATAVGGWLLPPRCAVLMELAPAAP